MVRVFRVFVVCSNFVIDVYVVFRSVGLSVIGTQAKAVYGRQWVKLLELLYRGVTQGVPSPDGSGTMFTIGGASPEGKAAKVRVQLEIERVMSS